MFNKKNVQKTEGKIIDIEAGMEGKVKFSSPVNLKISGKFEGELETMGHLSIGEKADVKAKVIRGENIVIEGRVKGDIVCTKRLELRSPASVVGNIEAPVLVIHEGTSLKGQCHVPSGSEKSETKKGQKEKNR